MLLLPCSLSVVSIDSQHQAGASAAGPDKDKSPSAPYLNPKEAFDTIHSSGGVYSVYAAGSSGSAGLPPPNGPRQSGAPPMTADLQSMEPALAVVPSGNSSHSLHLASKRPPPLPLFSALPSLSAATHHQQQQQQHAQQSRSGAGCADESDHHHHGAESIPLTPLTSSVFNAQDEANVPVSPMSPLTAGPSSYDDHSHAAQASSTPGSPTYLPLLPRPSLHAYSAAGELAPASHTR